MGTVDQVFTAQATALNNVARHSATNPVKVTFANTGAGAAVFHATLGFIAAQ
jgi:signal transduction histidine kinase